LLLKLLAATALYPILLINLHIQTIMNNPIENSLFNSS
jgi:hypothetical protein